MTNVPTLKVLALAVALVVQPSERVAPVDWMEENFVLIDGPNAGEKWSRRNAPQLVEILGCLDPRHPANRVSVRKSAQTGFTTIGIGWAGYVADVNPGNFLFVEPTGTLVKQVNDGKLQPAIDSNKALDAKIAAQRTRDAEGSTAYHKKFPGGFILLVGANSSVQLRSHTIRDALCDEIDDWPQDLAGQGDPMEMVDARQITFRRSGKWKRLEISTPKFAPSRIDQAFDEGDQRHFYVPCPHCKTRQKLIFENLDFKPDYPYDAHYKCASCGVLIEHHHKRWMVVNGSWVAENPGPGRHPSFHIDTLTSSFVGWDDIAAKFLKAGNDPEKLKTFQNLWLGLPFVVEGDAPDAEILLARRADYHRGTLPPGVLFMTCGVDVQGNRLEAEIVGWGVGKTSWQIDYRVLEGDTADLNVWAELARLSQETWEDWQGNVRGIERMAVDTGYRAQMVYQFVRGKPNCMAVKGANTQQAPVLATPTVQDLKRDGKKVKKGGVKLYNVGVWSLKATLYGYLGMEGPSETGYPPGWCFFPAEADLDYFNMLTAETLIREEKRGQIVSRWVKKARQPNEALDCRVYATAAAYKEGMGKWGPRQWAKLAADRGAPPSDEELGLLKAMLNPAAFAAEKEAPAPAPVEQPKTAQRVMRGEGQTIMRGRG